MSNQKPVETIRDGKLSASIWKNQSKDGVFFSVTFAHLYTDEHDQFKSATAFSGSDLLRLAQLATQAYQRQRVLRDSLK